MFTKVLIANRGEIAVRIARTLRDMGIRALAIFSEADRTARHVRIADEAYSLNPLQDTEAYLNIAAIVDIARRSGAQAVHPGYGFLSENAEFASACADAGLVFIGPRPEHIEIMGSKTTARQTMAKAGLPLVPGSNAGSDAELAAAAEQIGFPLLIKAVAGGGGRGMRLVRNKEELQSVLTSARRESQNAFGSDEMFLEKAIVRPRHVEVQVLGDRHGNAVHLFERDCSIQRRHQKIIEETPAPLSDATKKLLPTMHQAAQQATQRLGYIGAGTMEFLVSEQDNAYYFLEMNTRIQVEHPITELTTGWDLIEAQIRIAADLPMGMKQENIRQLGHALECRVYAEDPYRGFLPSPGQIRVMREPSGPNVRNDSGYVQGAEVPSAFDAMISKLCTWGPTRQSAIQRMQRALCEYAIVGIDTNLAYLSSIVGHEAFRSGHYSTDFIERYHQELQPPPLDPLSRHALAASAVVAQQDTKVRIQSASHAAEHTGEISAWRRAVCEPS